MSSDGWYGIYCSCLVTVHFVLAYCEHNDNLIGLLVAV